jgi:serine/threonine protein kinase
MPPSTSEAKYKVQPAPQRGAPHEGRATDEYPFAVAAQASSTPRDSLALDPPSDPLPRDTLPPDRPRTTCESLGETSESAINTPIERNSKSPTSAATVLDSLVGQFMALKRLNKLDTTRDIDDLSEDALRSVARSMFSLLENVSCNNGLSWGEASIPMQHVVSVEGSPKRIYQEGATGPFTGSPVHALRRRRVQYDDRNQNDDAAAALNGDSTRTPRLQPRQRGQSPTAGNISPARSDIDHRVVNGSFVGQEGDSTATPSETPRAATEGRLDVERSPAKDDGRNHRPPPGVTPLTTKMMKTFDRLPLMVVHDDVQSSGGESDMSASETKFSQSRMTEDNKDVFDGVNEYLLIEEVGRGQTGRVMKAVHAETCVEYAIKIVNRTLVVDHRHGSKPLTGSDAERAFKREVAVMRRLKHKSIVRLLEVIDDPAEGNVYLVMPLLKGPLVRFDEHRRCQRVSVDKVSTYVRQIVGGLQYLRKHRIVHRDLKPDNILLDEKGSAVLVDFGQSEWHHEVPADEEDYASPSGSDCDDDEHADVPSQHGADVMSSDPCASLSTFSNPTLAADQAARGRRPAKSPRAGTPAALGRTERNLGTPAFMAPEVINGAAPDFAGDVWSLGVIVYAMLYGQLPFSGHGGGRVALYDAILTEEPHYDDEAVDFIWNLLVQNCLTKDPRERISLGDLKRHPAVQRQSGPATARSVSSATSDLEMSATFHSGFDGGEDSCVLDDSVVPYQRPPPRAFPRGGPYRCLNSSPASPAKSASHLHPTSALTSPFIMGTAVVPIISPRAVSTTSESQSQGSYPAAPLEGSTAGGVRARLAEINARERASSLRADAPPRSVTPLDRSPMPDGSLASPVFREFRGGERDAQERFRLTHSTSTPKFAARAVGSHHRMPPPLLPTERSLVLP